MTTDIFQLVEKTGAALKQQGLKLATAESCTGGGLSYWLTNIPGSSAWFERGFVTYSDVSKLEMLDVKPDTLRQFGAVSEEAAREMAAGALRKSQADISIAITGIAGPTGGSADKPVGTVWMAWASNLKPTETKCYHFNGERTEVRQQTIIQALEKLLDML